MNFSKRWKRADPNEFPDYLEACTEFVVQTGFYRKVELVASYSSFMTGLKYYGRQAGYPQKYQVLICEPEPDNRYDPNALTLHNVETKQKMGYVPRKMAALISEKFAVNHGFVMVCYCCGSCTGKSAQCFYVVFAVS